jgi:hypothetical protein
LKLTFRLLPASYAIVRLAPDMAIPEWATRGSFFSITRTTDELSVICDERDVPADQPKTGGWRCLAAVGPFAFSEIGIAAEFTAVLARASISVLVVSTYDTDCVLVAAEHIERAMSALRGAGHTAR